MKAWIYAYAFFIIYSILGWVCESTYVSVPCKHFINRGFCYGPYIPIYGFGAMIAVYILIRFQSMPILVFLGGFVLTSVLEYFTSWAMEEIFHMRWWDYSHRKYNLNGRVCLLNSSLFGIMSVFVVYFVHPLTDDLIHSFSFLTLEKSIGVFSVVFVTDIIFTVMELFRRKHILEIVQTSMEAVQKSYEKEIFAKLDEMDQRQRQLEKQRQRLMNEWNLFCQRRLQSLVEFENWMKEHPEMSEQLDMLHNSMERLKKYRDSHISHAFPKRKFSDGFMEIKEWLDERNQ
jgi:uncharacterized membrane protein